MHLLCYRDWVSIRPIHLALVCLLAIGGLTSLLAQSFKLLDGQTVDGQPLSFTKDGVAFRDGSGSQGERVAYTNFTQQSLRDLLKHPKVKRPFIDPFLELVVEEPTNRVGRPKYDLIPHERLNRPDPKGGLSKLATSSVGLFFLMLLFAANLYSAYEVGIFRNYSPLLVLGIAFVAPVITQIIFLCLPTHVPKMVAEEVDATGTHVPMFATSGGAPSTQTSGRSGEHSGGGGQSSAPAGLPVYKRGEFTFNKRFFETKMSGFFGMRPSDAEKGLVFHIKSNKGQLLCNRVVRVTPAEATLQVLRGATIEELGVPFTDMVEIEIRQNS